MSKVGSLGRLDSWEAGGKLREHSFPGNLQTGGIQRYRDTGIHRYRDVGIHKYRDTGM